MLDLGVGLGLEYLGFRAQPAFMCEWEAAASAVLQSRMEDEALEPCPIWCGDMADFRGGPWLGAVDLFAAGLPCQPYSCAGKRLGTDDQRSYGDGDGPLPQFLRIVSECRPSVVFLENVPAWVCDGWFRPFGEELSGMGYTIEEPLFVTAESVGASHKRERVFILAHAGLQHGELFQRICGAEHPRGDGFLADARRPAIHEPVSSRRHGAATPFDESGSAMGHAERSRKNSRPARRGSRDTTCEPSGPVGDTPDAGRWIGDKGRRQSERIAAGGAGSNLVNAVGNGWSEGNVALQRSGDQSGAGQANDTGEGCGTVADTECPRSQGPRPAEPQRRNISGPCDGDGGIFALGPSDPRWATILAEQPWLAPAVESGFCLSLDGISLVVDASRADQLRCAGNAVVSLCAAVAIVELVRRVR